MLKYHLISKEDLLALIEDHPLRVGFGIFESFGDVTEYQLQKIDDERYFVTDSDVHKYVNGLDSDLKIHIYAFLNDYSHAEFMRVKNAGR